MIEKEKRDLDVFKKKQKVFREGITAQIREKEQVKIGERIAFFEEGVKLQREARLRRQKLEQVKEKKLKELRFVASVADSLLHVLPVRNIASLLTI